MYLATTDTFTLPHIIFLVLVCLLNCEFFYIPLALAAIAASSRCGGGGELLKGDILYKCVGISGFKKDDEKLLWF